jgi:hypothetical protein
LILLIPVLLLVLVLLLRNRILWLLRLLGILLDRRRLTGRNRIGGSACRRRGHHTFVYRSGAVTYRRKVSIRRCRIHLLRAIILVATGDRRKNCQYNDCDKSQTLFSFHRSVPLVLSIRTHDGELSS